tara:strand:- start:2245 stop:3102 length:858 start_codon:yes stop_codon:yes gene_type:complete
MNRISYSQLSMFNECPLRWKLNYVDDLSISEPSIHLLFGTAMHEVIQTWLEVMYHDSIKNADKLNLEQRLHDKMYERFQIDKEAYGKNPCTLEEMKEFFNDGVAILDFVKKKRADYFQKRQYELVGCEVPIEVMLKKDIKMVGYLDVVLRHKPTDTITIIDIKTSTRGWNKWMKADKNKTQQLLLYKQFYSKQYGTPIENIDVEYFIVKRKLWENTDFPQKRVQKFVPASGTVSMNKVNNGLNLFLENAFDDKGEYRTDKIFALPSKKSCRFCEFKNTEYCSYGV